MSGADVNLPTEILICWDTIAHAIREVLTTHNPSSQTQLEIVEYVRNDIAYVTYPDDIEDDMPDMLSGAIYNQNVLKSYTAGEENARK